MSRWPSPPAPDRAATAQDWTVDRVRRDRRLVRALTQAFLEELMAIEVEARCWSPAGERLTRRNGYRHALFPLSSGALPVWVPRLRQGGYAPTWLAAEPGPDEDELIWALCAAYVDGLADEDVAPLISSLGGAPVTTEERSTLAAAMNARVDALHGRLLLDVHGDDVTIETRRAGGDDAAVAIASTTIDGEPDVLGLVVGAVDTRTADDDLRHDLAARGLRGEVPATEPAAGRHVRGAVAILSRHHGRGRVDPDDGVEPDGRRSRRRISLLLVAVAALVLIAAVVGASAAERSHRDPASPAATPIAAASTTAPTTEAATDATLASPTSAPTAAPTSGSATTVAHTATDAVADCTSTPAGTRAPWMNEVLCEAADAGTR